MFQKDRNPTFNRDSYVDLFLFIHQDYGRSTTT